MKARKIIFKGGLGLILGGMLLLLGRGDYGGLYPRPARAEETMPSPPPVYQFRAHFVSFLPKDREQWKGDYALDSSHQPIWMALSRRLNRDLYNVKSPRGGHYYRPLVEVLKEGGVQTRAEWLSSPNPRVVEWVLEELDERFHFKVVATLEGKNSIGEFMLGHVRTPKLFLLGEGKPVAEFNYIVTLVLRVGKVFEDGNALMQRAVAVTSEVLKEGRAGKGTLHEIKLGEGYLLGGGTNPVQIRSFDWDPQVEEEKVIVPGYVILGTITKMEEETSTNSS